MFIMKRLKGKLITDVIDINHIFDNIKSIKIGFFTGNYGFGLSTLVKKWTRSKISHCEFILESKSIDNKDRIYLIGASAKTGVRLLEFTLDQWEEKQKEWILKDITITTSHWVVKGKNEQAISKLRSFFVDTFNTGYDTFGILWSNIFARKKENSKKYTCSEWCIKYLDILHNETLINPKWYSMFSPGDVYEFCEKNKIDINRK